MIFHISLYKFKHRNFAGSEVNLRFKSQSTFEEEVCYKEILISQR